MTGFVGFRDRPHGALVTINLYGAARVKSPS